MISELMMRMMNPVADDIFSTMLTKQYNDNPLVMMTIMEKLTLRAIAEAGIRAETGKPLSRPIGSNINQLAKEDLVSVDPVLARTLGIGYAGDALYLQ